MAETKIVTCGECRHFVRDGKCDFLSTHEGRARNRPFAHAPFWVWSDCYSDKELVRRDRESVCPTFIAKATEAANGK